MTQRLSFEKPTCCTLASCPRNTTGAALGSSGSQRRIVRSSLADTNHLLSGLNDTDPILPACPTSSIDFDVPGFVSSSSLSVWSQEPNTTQRLSGLKAASRTRSLNVSSATSFGSEPAPRSTLFPYTTLFRSTLSGDSGPQA